MKWTIEALDARVEREIAALPAGLKARFLRLAETLETHGPQYLGMPHVRHLDGGLWEMRLKAREGIARAIYVGMRGNRLIVLHVFVKKTDKTPRKALETARRRWKEVTDG